MTYSEFMENLEKQRAIVASLLKLVSDTQSGEPAWIGAPLNDRCEAVFRLEDLQKELEAVVQETRATKMAWASSSDRSPS